MVRQSSNLTSGMLPHADVARRVLSQLEQKPASPQAAVKAGKPTSPPAQNIRTLSVDVDAAIASPLITPSVSNSESWFDTPWLDFEPAAGIPEPSTSAQASTHATHAADAVGKSVRYGESVLLLHEKTRRYLEWDTSEHLDADLSAHPASVRTDDSSSAAAFQFQPSTRLQKRGADIFSGDEVALVAAGTSLRLTVSSSAGTPHAVVVAPVTASSSKWSVISMSTARQEFDSRLCHGDAVGVYNEAIDASLSLVHDASTEAGYAVVWSHQDALDPSVLWQLSMDFELPTLRHAITGLYLTYSGTLAVTSQPSASNVHLTLSSTSTGDVLCDAASVDVFCDYSGSKLYATHGNVLYGDAHAVILQEPSPSWLPAPLRLRSVDSHVIREKQVFQSSV